MRELSQLPLNEALSQIYTCIPLQNEQFMRCDNVVLLETPRVPTSRHQRKGELDCEEEGRAR